MRWLSARLAPRWCTSTCDVGLRGNGPYRPSRFGELGRASCCTALTDAAAMRAYSWQTTPRCPAMRGVSVRCVSETRRGEGLLLTAGEFHAKTPIFSRSGAELARVSSRGGARVMPDPGGDSSGPCASDVGKVNSGPAHPELSKWSKTGMCRFPRPTPRSKPPS